MSDLTPQMSLESIEFWLRTTEPEALEQLFATADQMRRDYVGDQVHLRGLIEISNYCTEGCRYCGIRNANQSVVRYRMDAQEIIDCAFMAQDLGYGTVVMQAGEDPGISAEWLAEIVEKIHEETDLAITLSMGERSPETIQLWRDAGADRYLLRMESSDLALFNAIHGTTALEHPRLALLEAIRKTGIETGSGVLVGVPGQTYRILAEDIAMFRQLDLDMIGIGPYVPHPQTPLAKDLALQKPSDDLVPNTEDTVYKVLALTRIVCPEANIPSTTALATINSAAGRQNGLNRGANIIMPNVTPQQYRRLYEIYPAKASSDQNAKQTYRAVISMLNELDRKPGNGKGSRRRVK